MDAIFIAIAQMINQQMIRPDEPGWPIPPVGNCIPISLFVARLLTRMGIEANMIEAAVLLVPDVERPEYNRLLGQNSIANMYRGHNVVHLIDQNSIVDFTLAYQGEPAISAYQSLLENIGQTLETRVGYQIATIPLESTDRLPTVEMGVGKIEWNPYFEAEQWRGQVDLPERFEDIADRSFEADQDQYLAMVNDMEDN